MSTGNGALRLNRLRDMDTPVLALSGEFDIDNVPDIERFLRRHLGPFFFRHSDLVLDLDLVTLVDSTFVGAVVSLVRRLHEHRHELLITRPAGYVRRTLALVGLPNLVPVYETLEEAGRALATGGALIPPPFELTPVGARGTARRATT